MSEISLKELNVYLKRIKGLNILVIGDIILDHYIWGSVERISPEAPVPVVEVTKEEYRLGGAANVAHNIQSLGGRVTLVGLVGQDHGCDILSGTLKDKGINPNGLIPCNRPTTVKTRVIAHHQQVIRFDRESRAPMSQKALKRLREFILDLRDHWDGVIVSDYKKGVVTRSLMNTIRKEFISRGLFVVVDPKTGNFPLYKGVSAITPNLKEASDGAGINIKDEKTLITAGHRIRKKLQCRCLLITRGEQGISVFTDNGVTHIPTVAREVFDVTGAGDTVVASFSAFYLAGAGFEKSARLANVAAGIVVSKVGTATTTPEEIKRFFREVIK